MSFECSGELPGGCTFGCGIVEAAVGDAGFPGERLAVATRLRLSATQRIIHSCSILSLPWRIALISSAAMKSDFVAIVPLEKQTTGFLQA